EHGAVATFFEVGNMAKEYPDLIKKELEYGCELGSHTYSHKDLKSISEEEAQAEIDKAIDVFVDITGEAPTLLRPPYGSIGDRKSLAKAPVVTWSVDTEDWKSRDPVAVLESIKSESNLDGMVVLMHSIHGSTYNALEDILDYLDSKGYQCVTVSELAYYKHGEVLEPGHLYGYSYFQPSDNSDN
ncbi:MAG: polysaccharide deacetylase family protein, partial [Oscillospiraceae bacterium]|nr:polysaccharide deacetylase family protein [Oscillospiraceae bacterium]